MEVLEYVLYGMIGILLIRLFLRTVIANKIRKKLFERAYSHVLNASEYQVKGKYD